MTALRQGLCLCAALPFFTFQALAQDAPKPPSDDPDKTVEQQVPQRITHSSRDNILTLTVENDMFGGGSDNNYTSGVRLGYMDVSTDMPDFAKSFADWMPGFAVNETTSLFYSIGQNLYTPDDITSPVQDPNDRPWAGFLYGSMGMSTITDNHSDEVELTLGVVGPAALGEQTQKFVHRHLSDSPMPKGWDNQLDNEPAMMVAWQRSFPRFMAGDIGPLFWTLTPHYGATLGNVYTFANTGISARIGPSSEKWQDAPARVRPAMPGTGFFEFPREDELSWYLFGGVDGRAMARNIFLDGNTFSNSYDIDKKTFVMDANAGIAFTYGQARLSYTAVYRTREFDGQNEPQIFGTVSLGYRF